MMIQSEQPPLIDLSPFKVMIDDVVAIVNPYLQEYFWNINVAAALVLFGVVPGGTTVALLAMMVFTLPAFLGMWFITVPVLVLNIVYWIALAVTVGPMVATMAL